MVALLQDGNLAAEKISRSGYTGPDLSVPLLGKDRLVEVKARGSGFQTLYGWLEKGADFLIIKQNNKRPLVVIPLALALRVARAAEERRADQDTPVDDITTLNADPGSGDP